MHKMAALFGGQGAQYPGMGKELYDRFAVVREIYECAGDILGFDVAGISFSGDEEQQRATRVAQALIFTHSVAAFAVARDNLPPLQAVAGHSLGEYAALHCAGAFSLEDGFRIIKVRAEAMEEQARRAGGAMYAIIGSTEEAVAAACGQAAGFVQPVNFNLPGQTVISGEEQACARAAEELTRQGARAVRLSVNSAFHTVLMQPAADRVRTELANIGFAPLRMDFYSNLTGARLVVQDYPAYFAEHMVSPVRFTAQMQAMHDDGIVGCIEFGPKKTAATLAKKNVRAFAVYNIEDVATLEKTQKALRAR